MKIKGIPAFSIVLALYAGVGFISMINSCNESKNQARFSTITGPYETSEPVINDSLPYYQYQRKRDSIEQTKIYLSNKIFGYGSGFSSPLLNVFSENDCSSLPDSIFIKNRGMVDFNLCTPKYYLELPGYQLDKDANWYSEDGKNFLKYVIWDTTYESYNGGKGKKGHYEKNEVMFRFKKNGDNKNQTTGKVQIAVPKPVYYAFYAIVGILVLLCLYFFLKIFISFPFAFIIEISKGEIFTQRTIDRLYFSGWLTLLFPLGTLVLKLIFRILFYKYFTAEVTLNWIGHILDSWPFLLVGFLILATATAFKKGYELQKENELTV